MSRRPSLSEKIAGVETLDKNGGSSKVTQEGPNEQLGGPVPITVDLKSPPTNVAPSPLNKDDAQPATAQTKDPQSDERIENLVELFRDFLEFAPNKMANTSYSTHPDTQKHKKMHKRLFGLAKGLSPETGSGNRYNYEQKYPRDEFGKESAENARVWLTYLDEAELFDRERAEGWKETVDVLLVFAGLFSGVITTFISQASQSLQQDNTQVSASLLFEAVQLLRANFSGVPASHVPSSVLTPTSPFTPSTNSFLVNGLWFTSLAITLSVALFAVLAKQWLYYYLSSITGTPNEKVRARQLRYDGFESWKVAAIVDLLPILLHLAVGLFLTGIIILLFPLDVRVAWVIFILTGVTYTSYFISVMLPIWYPECPYTTSLTIYIGILFFILRPIPQKIAATLDEVFYAVLERINPKARLAVEHIARYTQILVRYVFGHFLMLRVVMLYGFQTFRSIIFPSQRPKFTKWREENIKKAIEKANFLDFEALNWLYATSPNRSVHRIIARCAATRPAIGGRFDREVLRNLRRTLEISETNLVDLCYGLCLDVAVSSRDRDHWRLLRSNPDVVESQLEKAEYQTCLCIEDIFTRPGQERRALRNAIAEDLNLPLALWSHLLERTVIVATEAVAHTLIHDYEDLFQFDPIRALPRDVGLVRFGSEKLRWWRFEYLFRYFKIENLDYLSLDVSDAKAYETRYRLLIDIYRNLTSNDPLISGNEQRQVSLIKVFRSFSSYLISLDRSHPAENALRFFKEICCVDSFWSWSMTFYAKRNAVLSLSSMRISMGTSLYNRLPSMDSHDLSLIYQWYSRDLGSELSYYTPPLFTLLLVSHNRHHLSTILSDDPDPVLNFSECLHNLANSRDIGSETRIVYPALMDLLNSTGTASSKHPLRLSTILYDPAVLLQMWRLLIFVKRDTKKYFRLVKSKIDRHNLVKLSVAMSELARYDKDLETLLFLNRGVHADVRSAFVASALEFGQLVGVSHTPLESTPGQFPPENAAQSDKDHDIEERAEVPDSDSDERGIFHSIASWTKEVFESIWPKTSRQMD